MCSFFTCYEYDTKIPSDYALVSYVEIRTIAPNRAFNTEYAMACGYSRIRLESSLLVRLFLSVSGAIELLLSAFIDVFNAIRNALSSQPAGMQR